MAKTKSPVLLMIFNRMSTTEKVFERIRAYQPEQLFIASDGARSSKPEEAARVQEVREYVLAKIDWNCQVHTLFRESNLGCGVAPYQAITWFFENVESGIVLEDDCLPYVDFFPFCEEVLEKYKDDNRVWSVSGTNLQGGMQRGNGAYYFSNYSGIWGWASWARAWKHYDYSMSNYPQFIRDNKIADIFKDRKQQKFWIKTLNNASKPGSWWDYQWLYTIWNYKGLCIIPNVNLVKNIGFNAGGTHTLNEPRWYRILSAGKGELKNIVHPKEVIANTEADDFFYRKCFKVSYLQRLYTRVSGAIKRRLV